MVDVGRPLKVTAAQQRAGGFVLQSDDEQPAFAQSSYLDSR
jgi:hypothetical protein